MLGDCMVTGTIHHSQAQATCGPLFLELCLHLLQALGHGFGLLTGFFWEGRHEWTWDRQYPGRHAILRILSQRLVLLRLGTLEKSEIAAVRQNGTQKNMSLQMLLSSTSNSWWALPKGLSRHERIQMEVLAVVVTKAAKAAKDLAWLGRGAW